MGWVELPPGTLYSLTDEKWEKFREDHVFPAAFMTGDGHRTPSFRWTESCPKVKELFADMLAKKRLCAYVEVRPDAVSVDLVPPFLSELNGQGRLMGWELPLFENLQPSMNKSLEVASAEVNQGSLPKFMGLLEQFLVETTRAKKSLGENAINNGTINQCVSSISNGFMELSVSENLSNDLILGTQKSAKDYFNTCMNLRCSPEYHQRVGENIQRNILQLGQNVIHLISVGDSHTTCTNPLKNYINLDVVNSLGSVDRSQQ